MSRALLAIALPCASLALLQLACQSAGDPRDDLQDTSRLIRGADGQEHALSGRASWYGERHHGRRTACGEAFDMYAFTAAHKTLPFYSIVRVVERDTLKEVVVRINDRGPYSKGRVIDLSRAAARDLGIERQGLAVVDLDVLAWGDGRRCE